MGVNTFTTFDELCQKAPKMLTCIYYIYNLLQWHFANKYARFANYKQAGMHDMTCFTAILYIQNTYIIYKTLLSALKKERLKRW